MSVFGTLEAAEAFLPEDYPMKGRAYIPGSGDESPDVLVLKSTPSFVDAKQHQVWSGDDGRLIRLAVFKTGSTSYWAAAAPFLPPPTKPKLKELLQFQRYLSEVIRRVGAKKIILFGADVVNMCREFEHTFRRFGDVAGQEFEFGEYQFLVLPHPAIYAHNPGKYTQAVEEIQRFLAPPMESAESSGTLSENYVVVRDREHAQRVLPGLRERVAVDIETTGLDIYDDTILTIQLSDEAGTGYSFLWEHLTPEEWGRYLRTKHLVFQNGTFDVKFLAVNGVHVEIGEDTMLMHSLIDETPGSHSLDAMARRYLTGAEKWGDMVNFDAMEDNDAETLGIYGARDADITLRLANEFKPKMEGRYIHTVLHDAQNAILKSELVGVRVDRAKAKQFQTEIEKALHDRQLYIEDVYGLRNPNSPRQVSALLYDEMGLPTLGRSRTTSEAALLNIGEDVPVVRDILEYRNLTKASGTYIKRILESSERDGRYHGDFKLAATETGRLTEPMLLLLPRADNVEGANLGKQYQYRLRELFIPDPGMVMIGADYAGLEIAMAAHIASDVQLIQDVVRRVDIHSTVAVEAFGLDVPLEPVETLRKRVGAKHEYERTLAKAGVFAWLYGGDASTISRNLSIPLEQAQDIINALTSLYRGVAEWQTTTRMAAQEYGYVATPWGRRRHFNFSGVFSAQVREAQFRECTNMPIQGMASDMTLKAFVDVHRRGVQTLFPFHDAIYVQAYEAQADEVADILREAMETSLPGPVPFRVDVQRGYNWGEVG